MIGQILDWLIGPLGAALGAIVAMVAAYVTGNRQGRQRAKNEALRGYKNTREKLDAVAADLPDDPGVLREWMRERGRKP